MNILFRVDSSSKIGLGHLMPCLVLAEQYKKDNVIFAKVSIKNNYQLIMIIVIQL